MKTITGTSPLSRTYARTTWPLTTICTMMCVWNNLPDSISYITRILICYRVKMMFASSFWEEWCYQTTCSTHAQAGALGLRRAGCSYVNSESCSASRCVSRLFEASVKKTDLWLDLISREDVWKNKDCCSHLQSVHAWESILIISCPSQL